MKNVGVGISTRVLSCGNRLYCVLTCITAGNTLNGAFNITMHRRSSTACGKMVPVLPHLEDLDDFGEFSKMFEHCPAIVAKSIEHLIGLFPKSFKGVLILF